MKQFILLFCLMALSGVCVNQVGAQPTAEFAWHALNGPFGGTITEIASDGNGTVYAGSALGQHGLHRSTDGGLTWTTANEGINDSYAFRVPTVFVADSGHVLISTSSCCGVWLYRSTDGGDSWKGTAWNGPAGRGPTSFARTPEGHILTSDGKNVFRSEDNGHTWLDLGVPPTGIVDMAVNDSGYIFVWGGDFVRSKDGGSTWESMGASRHVLSVAIDADGNFFAGNWGEYESQSGVFRSEDDGATWTPVKLGFRVNEKGNIAVMANGDILVGSWGQGIWRSTDGGTTWAQSNDGLGHLYMRNLHVTADGLVFAGTEGGGLYRSDDGGTSWTQVGITAATARHLKYDSARGWLLAAVNGVAISEDEGTSWRPINSGLTSMDTRATDVAPDGTIYVATGGSPYVFRSDDEGHSWVGAGAGVGGSRGNVVRVGPDGTVYAGTSSGIYTSADRGVSWTPVHEMTDVNSLVFNAAGDLFAGSWGSGIQRRLYGETSWTILAPGNNHFFTVFVESDGTVHADGLVSTDNGDTWANPGFYWPSGFVENELGILFAGTTNTGDFVYRSTSHFLTRERVAQGLPDPNIQAVAIDTDGYVYAAPAGYSVYKTVLPTTISTAVEDRTTPEGFTLEQNYPNPFNPSTTIGFSAARSGRVRIRVYDLLGREVATAIDRVVDAGSHRVTWDATGAPSGVYVYRLEAGASVLERTLVLLR